MYFWNIPQCNPSKPGDSIIADQKDKQCLRPYRRCLCGIPYPETSGNGSSQLGRCQRHQDWECRTLEKDLGADRRASLNINSKSREAQLLKLASGSYEKNEGRRCKCSKNLER